MYRCYTVGDYKAGRGAGAEGRQGTALRTPSRRRVGAKDVPDSPTMKSPPPSALSNFDKEERAKADGGERFHRSARPAGGRVRTKEAIMKSLSIISTTYEKEKGENLDECLSSVFSQNIMPEKVILVGDGKLTDELYGVIEKYKSKYPEMFVYYETENNNGNWFASNKAIELCSTDIIAKIDSDDILMPEYSENILSEFEKGIDICGVYIDEFDDLTKEIISTKKTPTTHEEIYKFAKRRNPFNNPGIAFSKEFADKIGGYNEMVRCEDYDFVVRMLAAGAKGSNVPESLVKYRTSKDNMKRRKNFVNTKWFIISRYRIYKSGFSSFTDFLIPCMAQLVLFIMPSALTGKIYGMLRR